MAQPLLNLDGLERFADPLPIPRVLTPSGTRPSPDPAAGRIPYYRVAMRQVESKVHRDLKPTRLWGYGKTSPGPTIETRRGEAFLVEWANELPKRHFLTIDHAVHGAEKDKPDVRAVTHLRGAKAPPESDGYPERWYVPGKSAVYHYPNDQEAAMLWYHDHALGITRLNMYAGLFGALFVRDSVEDELNLPKGKYEIPLTIYDRFLDREAQLYHPVSPDPESPWVPEVFGDAILVNGKLFPYLEVEPRKYRFRLLNAANGRFFRLALSSAQEFYQIGSDLGFVSSPAPLKSLTIAPAERADFSVTCGCHGVRKVVTRPISARFQMRAMIARISSSLAPSR
jgi:spore coat protein A